MSIASDLISDARNFSAGTLASAISEMGAAMDVLQNLGHTIGSGPKFPNLIINVPDPGDPGDVPPYTGSHMDPDIFDGKKPTLTAVNPLVLPADPTLPPPDLTFDAPIAPSGEPDPSLLNNPPSLAALPTFPVTPDLQGEIQSIVKPELLALDIPDAPVYQAPEFTGIRPVFDVEMPTDLDVTLRSNYDTINPVMREAVTSQLDAFLDREFPQFRSGMAAIEARLATYLAGGSALTPQIEDAIFNRTLDKTNVDARRAAQEAIGKAARMGWKMVSPTILSQLQDIDQERRNNNARAATDIAIEQAKLEQNNLQFAVTQSGNLRNMAINASLSYYGGLVQINQHSLEYARSVVDAIVKAFDIAARYAETQARLYEAEADIYKARLEGAMASIRVYEALIHAEEAKVNANRTVVEAYRARLEAVQAEANVYRAAVDAVVAEAGLERLKVELYNSRVQGYAAQVNAYSARWQGYGYAVQGQAAKMQVNVEHSRAYEARANAYTAIVRGKTAAVEAGIQTNTQLLNQYKTDVEAYAALEHAKVESVSLDTAAYHNTIQAYVAKATAISERSRSIIAKAEVQLRSLIAEAELDMEELREQHKMDIARVTGTAQVAVSAGGIFAGVAQAAMSGMNSLAAEVVSATE